MAVKWNNFKFCVVVTCGITTGGTQFTRLKAAVQEIYFEREIAERGHRFQKLRQGKFVVKNWKRFVKYNRHSKIQRQVAFRHYANSLGRKVEKPIAINRKSKQNSGS